MEKNNSLDLSKITNSSGTKKEQQKEVQKIQTQVKRNLV